MLPYCLMFVGFILTAVLSSMWTLWVVHVCRSGANPLPTIPRIFPMRRQAVNGDKQEVDSKPAHRVSVGP